MKISLKIKQIASILLFITFFLPLSECTKKIVMAETDIVPYDSVTESDYQKDDEVEGTIKEQLSNIESSAIVEPHVPYKLIEIDDYYTWLIPLAFMWPLLVIYLFYSLKRKKFIFWVKIIEPFAALGSAYVILGIVFFGEILFAGYFAIASIVSYFLASCYDLFTILRSKKQNEPSPSL